MSVIEFDPFLVFAQLMTNRINTLNRFGNCGKINMIIERRRCLMKRNIIKSRAQFIKGKAYI